MRAEPILRGLRKAAERPNLFEAAHRADPWEALTAELKPPLSDQDALIEAYRCLLCGGPHNRAPCTLACPADVNVAGFIAALTEAMPVRAAEIIHSANPLGGTCARVCPTEELCEGACVLSLEGQRPVDIARLQRYATDQAVRAGNLTIPKVAEANGKGVAIIGAGPAGLTVAAVLAPKGYQVEVFDENLGVGGLVRSAIAPYRQLLDPLPVETQRLVAMGVTFHLEREIRPEDLGALQARFDAIFLGVGMGEDASSGVKGSDLVGVWKSLRFVKQVKSGHLPRLGERVAIIGGGNTAMDMAREAVRLGANHVTVLYRRGLEEMPAFYVEYEEAVAEGVEFAWLTGPTSYLGAEQVERIQYQRMHLGEPDESGRRRPIPISGEEFSLEVDSVIEAIGQKARSTFIAAIPSIQSSGGNILVDEATGQCRDTMYFAGGDILNGGATVVEAVRLGKIAAAGIHASLNRGGDE